MPVYVYKDSTGELSFFAERLNFDDDPNPQYEFVGIWGMTFAAPSDDDPT